MTDGSKQKGKKNKALGIVQIKKGREKDGKRRISERERKRF